MADQTITRGRAFDRFINFSDAITAVAITLLAYALEERGPVWVLIFAGGSFSSGIYALLQGAWPFAIAEAAWTVIALQRWRRQRLLRF